jgi:zinc resistance-associated protein
MMHRIPAGLALGALLGSTALLSSIAFADTTPAPANSAPAAATPAPANAAKPGLDDRNKADNKAMETFQAFFDAKLAGLHAGLQLTAAQAPLWTPVEAAIRDLAKLHRGPHREHGDEGGHADGLQELKMTSERMIRGGHAMKALADAAGPLTASLTEDQKDRLPKLIEGIKPHRVLEKAFNVASEDEGREGMRWGHDHERRHEAQEDHGSDQERDRGGDREGGYHHRHHHGFEGRAFGDRNRDERDFGERGPRWDRHHGEERGSDYSERFRHDEDRGEGDHHMMGGRHQDSEDERT